MADPASGALDRLFQLQELQSEIKLKTELATRTPEHLIHIEAMYLDFVRSLNEVSERVSRSEARKKILMDEIAALQQKQAKYQDQMAGMKTGQTMYDILDQIEEMKKTVRVKENEVLELEETLVSERADLDAKKASQPEEDNRYEEQMKDWREEQANLKQQAEAALKKAEEVRKTIDRRLLSLFDRIAKNRNAIGIAKVVMVRTQTAACSACNVMLRPQLLSDLRMAKETITCESCKRILYWDGGDN